MKEIPHLNFASCLRLMHFIPNWGSLPTHWVNTNDFNTQTIIISNHCQKGKYKSLPYGPLMSENCSMHFTLLTVRGLKTSNANDIIWLWPHCTSHPPPACLSSWLRQTDSSALDHLPSPDTLWFIANYLSRSIIDYSVIFLALLNLLAQEHSSSQGAWIQTA